MSASVACQHCGCTEIDKDAARGNSVCTNCGAVLEEGAIVAEVEFLETGAGGHAAVGQFISADAPGKLRLGSLPGISTKESREITLKRDKQIIQEIGSQLRLNQHCQDTAFNFVKMAVARGITRGRRSSYVVAACLYITCRLEGTPHLLLDFSDVMQVNVYELGKVYSFIARSLYINLPPTDPCVYVMRFAHSLSFGDKEHEVTMVALRLVQRMKRDWMGIGRRPTGLCGAALLLAARYHNFNRTVNDIVRVVNVAESVLRRRLEEFASTPSSELTLDEFQSVDLEQECDPPSFREARSRAKRQQQQDNEQLNAKLKNMERDFAETHAAMEQALNSLSKKRTGPYSRYASTSSDDVSKMCWAGSAASGDRETDDEQRFLAQHLIEEVLPTISSETRDGIEDVSTTPAEKYRALQPTLESMGVRTSTDGGDDPETDAVATTSEQDDGRLVVDDLDDKEIDSYLLTSDEVQLKQELWDANYEEFLQQTEEKRRLKAEEKAKEELEGKKRRVRVRRKPIQAATAGEAIEKIVQEKKLSNKINYEVLKSLGVVPSDETETEQVLDTSVSVGVRFARRR